jgi:hypothetical protein
MVTAVRHLRRWLAPLAVALVVANLVVWESIALAVASR